MRFGSSAIRSLHSARRRMACGAAVLILLAAVLDAQIPQVTPVGQGLQTESIAAAGIATERSSEPSTLTYFNRPVVVLRARVAGREPTERVIGARRILDDLVRARLVGPVGSQPFQGGVLIVSGSHGVMVLTGPDIDELAGETLE